MRVGISWARRDIVLAALASLPALPLPASAAYGEFAKIAAAPGSDFAAGDTNNKCLFAQPGTGVCTVYESSQPKLWATPDTAKSLAKLVSAAEALDALDGFIAKSQWMKISQALGAAQDLREAVGFLTKAADSPEAAKLAKKVFLALDGVALAAQKKDAAAAKLYFSKYSAAMPELIRLLD